MHITNNLSWFSPGALWWKRDNCSIQYNPTHADIFDCTLVDGYHIKKHLRHTHTYTYIHVAYQVKTNTSPKDHTIITAMCLRQCQEYMYIALRASKQNTASQGTILLAHYTCTRTSIRAFND